MDPIPLLVRDGLQYLERSLTFGPRTIGLWRNKEELVQGGGIDPRTPRSFGFGFDADVHWRSSWRLPPLRARDALRVPLIIFNGFPTSLGTANGGRWAGDALFVARVVVVGAVAGLALSYLRVETVLFVRVMAATTGGRARRGLGDLDSCRTTGSRTNNNFRTGDGARRRRGTEFRSGSACPSRSNAEAAMVHPVRLRVRFVFLLVGRASVVVLIVLIALILIVFVVLIVLVALVVLIVLVLVLDVLVLVLVVSCIDGVGDYSPTLGHKLEL